jgi:hypothetical protein
MPYRIENKTGTTVLLRLRSGVTLHLGAGQTSPELEDADVLNNPRIEKLVARGSVTMVDVEEASAGGAPRRPRRSEGTTTAGRRTTTRTAPAEEESKQEQ